jgi:hypothetical protein
MDSPQLRMQGFRDGNFVTWSVSNMSRRFAGHIQEITDPVGALPPPENAHEGLVSRVVASLGPLSY